VAILLNASDTQSAEAGVVDTPLPILKFFGSEGVTLACLAHAEESSCDCRNHFGLAARCPSSCIDGGEIFEREKLAERANSSVDSEEILLSKNIKSVCNFEHERLFRTLR
jgi:hypothetical protein